MSYRPTTKKLREEAFDWGAMACVLQRLAREAHADMVWWQGVGPMALFAVLTFQEKSAKLYELARHCQERQAINDNFQRAYERAVEALLNSDRLNIKEAP